MCKAARPPAGKGQTRVPHRWRERARPCAPPGARVRRSEAIADQGGRTPGRREEGRATPAAVPPTGPETAMGPKRPPSPPRATAHLLPFDRPGTSPALPRSPPGPTLGGSGGPLHVPMGTRPLCSRTSPQCDPSLLWPQLSPSATPVPPRDAELQRTSPQCPETAGARGVGGLHDPPDCTHPAPLLLDLLNQRHAVAAQPRPVASSFAPFPLRCVRPIPASAPPCTPGVCASSRRP